MKAVEAALCETGRHAGYIAPGMCRKMVETARLWSREPLFTIAASGQCRRNNPFFAGLTTC